MFNPFVRLFSVKEPFALVHHKRKRIHHILPLLILATPLFASAQDLSTKRPTVSADAVRLDWRKIEWPPIVYNRVGLDHGAGLYSLGSTASRKTRLELLFSSGVYTLPESSRPELGAYVDLLVEGGTQSRSYEQLQRYSAQHGIVISSSLDQTGNFRISVESLSTDFTKALQLLQEILAEPAFRQEALETWKRNQQANFEDLLDASSLREQYRILESELVKLTLGPNHYFSTFLKRQQPSRIAQIKREEVVKLHNHVINAQAVNAFLVGGGVSKHMPSVEKFIGNLPSRELPVFTWLPGRMELPASEGAHILVIKKADMPQSSVYGRLVMQNAIQLNPLEEAHFAIARNVFSSTSGVVGEDRFSGALRKESGLSYSPYAYPDLDAVSPSTGVAQMNFIFQTPTEKTAEGLALGWKTWQEFRKKGVTQREFEQTQTILINKALSQEQTIFDRANVLLNHVVRGEVPPTLPDVQRIRILEQLKSHVETNRLIERLTRPEQTRFAYVIIGGLSEDEIEEIEDLKFVSSIQTIEFEDFTKMYR